MTKKTAYLVANIHQGTGVRMWDTLNEEVKLHRDNTVFILPGGRLGYKKADEYLRNHIFRYANEKNFDGAVVWGSTLSGTATWQEAQNYTIGLSRKIPVVSMGIDIDNIPSVNFDAYSGIYKLVEHFITVHNSKRIVFLRGPEKHLSANSRYQAYLDCLKDYNIEIEEDFISSPYPWAEGESAIKEIVERNQKTPKTDFDTVIASSDIMAFSVSKYLEEKGYFIPDDVSVAGFNDSQEAFLSPTELTTVRMPIREMLDSSFSMILDMENSVNESPSVVMLPSIPIYRRSCGCLESFGSFLIADKTIHNWDDYEKWIKERMEKEECYLAFLAIVKDIFINHIPINEENRRHYSELCWRYIKHGGTMKLFFSSIRLARYVTQSESISLTEVETLHEIMMEGDVRVSATLNYRSGEMEKSHNSFANALLKAHNYQELAEKMRQYFPKMGIDKAFIFIYDKEGKTHLECGFSSEQIYTSSAPFSDELLYPEELEDEMEKGLFVVCPLFFETEIKGYMIIKNKDCKSTIIESIRTDISASMQDISLYSIACEKSEKAEEAEKKAIEYYEAIAEELKKPLLSIKEQALSEKIDKNTLLSTVLKAEHLLNLSVIETEGLTIEKKYVPGSFLVSLIENKGISITYPSYLPSLDLDKKRFSDLFDYLISTIGNSFSACISFDETKLLISLRGVDFSSFSSSTSSWQYIERILILHGGSFSFSPNALEIKLPYPSICGELAECGGDEGIAFISESENDIPSLLGNKVKFISYDEIVQAINNISSFSSIAWNAKGGESRKSLIAMNLIRNHKEAKRLPFLCFGLEEEYMSVCTAVEASIPGEGKGSIYSFGRFPSSLEIMREFAPIEEIKDLSDIALDSKSSLFVFSTVDIERIEAIRKERRFSKTPIVVINDKFKMEEAEELSSVPGVLLVNTSITEAEGFINRLIAVFGGEELLPPLTSILVKKAIAYLNENATHSISRWQIAGSVNISEDYLTRIFRKEMGISPWDYLNRYRIQIASSLLLETGTSISEIAFLTGFQDQAYFCRVFRKVKGFPPGNIRNR